MGSIGVHLILSSQTQSVSLSIESPCDFLLHTNLPPILHRFQAI